MADLFASEPDVFRAAYWFTLTDWSAETASLISQPICDEGLLILCSEVQELTETYGLLNWSDGSPKLAFQVLVDRIMLQ